MTQIEYLEILFNDCGFSGAQRRDFLGLRYNGPRHLDQLSAIERSALIDEMKKRKPGPPPYDADHDQEAELTARERFKKRAIGEAGGKQ